jgi:hypothetical protein
MIDSGGVVQWGGSAGSGGGGVGPATEAVGTCLLWRWRRHLTADVLESAGCALKWQEMNTS